MKNGDKPNGQIKAKDVHQLSELEALKAEINAKIVEQDHRLISVVTNFFKYRSGPNHLKSASISAVWSLFYRLFFLSRDFWWSRFARFSWAFGGD